MVDGKMEKGRNVFLDNVKGVCILFVVITHFSWNLEEIWAMFFPFWIDMAVPIFMIISGYVYALSFSRKKVNCLVDAYNANYIICKIIKYTVPYTIIFGIEIYLEEIRLKQNINIHGIVTLFFQGGMGPGSYYYPMLLQLVFIFPIVYFIIKKYKFGILLCFFANFIYEVLKTCFSMSEEHYRLLIFRFIFLIGWGVHLAIGKDRIKKLWYIVAEVVGIIYIYMTCYTGYMPTYISYWPRTSFMAVLYVIPLFTFFFRRYKNTCFKGLAAVGKASYNIFLVQMLYYRFFDEIVASPVQNRWIHLLINVILCIFCGFIFNKIEIPFSNYIANKTCDLWNKNRDNIIKKVEYIFFEEKRFNNESIDY